MSARTIIAGLAIMAGLAVPASASAAIAEPPFMGPWDSAHQPATVEPSAGLTVLAQYFGVAVSRTDSSLAMCKPIDIRLAEPSGSTTSTLTPKWDPTSGCQWSQYVEEHPNPNTTLGSWKPFATTQTTGSPEFVVSNGSSSTNNIDIRFGLTQSFPPAGTYKSVLYTVADNTGVIAQKALTLAVDTFKIYSGTSQYSSVCWNKRLYSDSRGVYCLSTQQFVVNGWPAPPSTPAPQPPITAQPISTPTPPASPAPPVAVPVSSGYRVGCVRPSGGNLMRKPRNCNLSFDAMVRNVRLTKLRWYSWGSSTTKAVGKAQFRTEKPIKVMVTFSKLQICGIYKIYTRAVVKTRYGKGRVTAATCDMLGS